MTTLLFCVFLCLLVVFRVRCANVNVQEVDGIPFTCCIVTPETSDLDIPVASYITSQVILQAVEITDHINLPVAELLQSEYPLYFTDADLQEIYRILYRRLLCQLSTPLQNGLLSAGDIQRAAHLEMIEICEFIRRHDPPFDRVDLDDFIRNLPAEIEYEVVAPCCCIS